VHNELPAFYGSLEIGGPIQSSDNGRLEVGLINLVTTLAASLCRVHGHVCRLHQLGRVLVPAWLRAIPTLARTWIW